MKAARALAALLLLTSLAGLYLLTAGGHLYSPDEEIMFRTTEALIKHGTLAVEPLHGFGTQRGRDDQEFGQYGIGASLFAVPFYLSGPIVERAFPGATLWGVLNTDSLVNHERYRYGEAIDYARRFAVSHMNIVVTLLQVWVLCLFAFSLSGNLVGGVMVGLTYGLATQAWPHAKTFFSEPLATLCLTVGAYLIWTGFARGSLARHWLAGAALGFAVLTRLDSVVALPGLAVMFYLMLRSTPPLQDQIDPHRAEPGAKGLRTLGAHVAVALPLLLTAGLILALNAWKFGSPFSTGYEDQPEGFRFDTPLRESLPGYFWSPGRSIFIHSPPILLGVIGFGALMRRAPALGIGVATVAVSTLLFHAKWHNWSGGWDWGPRHIFSLIAWCMVPLGAMLSREARLPTRIAAIIFFIVGFAVQLFAISQNPIEFHYVYYVQGRYAEIAYVQTREPPDGEDLIWSWRWSAWDGYRRLRRVGVHDLFWLRHWRWKHPPETRWESRRE